ncbi:MAG: hypothetical protein EBU66_15650 [Bacteroidetes bacterium]|nr:hypothetical protein [Bacteroidota bacterium]
MKETQEFIKNIIKKQNLVLLKAIADKFNIDYNDLIHKYHTPSFYVIHSDTDKNYEIIQI